MYISKMAGIRVFYWEEAETPVSPHCDGISLDKRKTTVLRDIQCPASSDCITSSTSSLPRVIRANTPLLSSDQYICKLSITPVHELLLLIPICIVILELLNVADPQ